MFEAFDYIEKSRNVLCVTTFNKTVNRDSCFK